MIFKGECINFKIFIKYYPSRNTLYIDVPTHQRISYNFTMDQQNKLNIIFNDIFKDEVEVYETSVEKIFIIRFKPNIKDLDHIEYLVKEFLHTSVRKELEEIFEEILEEILKK